MFNDSVFEFHLMAGRGTCTCDYHENRVVSMGGMFAAGLKRGTVTFCPGNFNEYIIIKRVQRASFL